MTLKIQNRSIVIWLKMFKLHWGAAGCSKLSTESLGHYTVKIQSARSYPKWNLRRKIQLHETHDTGCSYTCLAPLFWRFRQQWDQLLFIILIVPASAWPPPQHRSQVKCYLLTFSSDFSRSLLHWALRSASRCFTFSGVRVGSSKGTSPTSSGLRPSRSSFSRSLRSPLAV